MRVKVQDKKAREKTNITLKLDRDLLKRMKILAAQRETSISALVTVQIEELLKKDDKYEERMNRALARMKRGMDIGWNPPASRDELHER